MRTPDARPGVESAVKAGSPRIPGSATAGTPSDATAVTRPGASTARQQRPHAAQRGADDRDAFQVERVEQRRELRNRVLAQRSPRVVKRVAEPEPRQVEGDQPVAGEMGQQRRPGRRAHAAAVHEQNRRTIARLEHTNSKRRISQADASTRDLDRARVKQPPLGDLEGCCSGVGCMLGHRSAQWIVNARSVYVHPWILVDRHAQREYESRSRLADGKCLAIRHEQGDGVAGALNPARDLCSHSHLLGAKVGAGRRPWRALAARPERARGRPARGPSHLGGWGSRPSRCPPESRTPCGSMIEIVRRTWWRNARRWSSGWGALEVGAG